MTGMRARLKEFQREASLIPGFSGRVADGIVGLFGLFTSQAQGPGHARVGAKIVIRRDWPDAFLGS